MDEIVHCANRFLPARFVPLHVLDFDGREGRNAIGLPAILVHHTDQRGEVFRHHLLHEQMQTVLVELYKVILRIISS